MSLIVPLIRSHKKHNEGFVIYRLPNQKQIHFLSGTNAEFNENSFVFCPFDTNYSTLFLNPKVEKAADSLPDLLGKIPAIPSPITSHDLLDKPNGFSTSKTDYTKAFQIIQEEIETGRIEKAILSKKKIMPFSLSKISTLLETLLISHPQAMVHCFYHPQSGCWIGASPEIILEQKGDCYKTTALAGTKTKESTPWKPKELKEQKIVKDFIVKELNEIKSTYTVSDLKTIKAGNIYHLKQLIEFKIPNTNLLDLVHKLHPTPAIGGYPKKEARTVIDLAEEHSREYYCGYLGKITPSNSSLFVNLRCAKISDHFIEVFTGGGITAESVLENEWEECEKKASHYSNLLEK